MTAAPLSYGGALHEILISVFVPPGFAVVGEFILLGGDAGIIVTTLDVAPKPIEFFGVTLNL